MAPAFPRSRIKRLWYAHNIICIMWRTDTIYHPNHSVVRQECQAIVHICRRILVEIWHRRRAGQKKAAQIALCTQFVLKLAERVDFVRSKLGIPDDCS